MSTPRKIINARVEEPIADAATAVLTNEHREMNAFLVACLIALADRPAETLAFVAAYWPPPRPPGRPRKRA